MRLRKGLRHGIIVGCCIFKQFHLHLVHILFCLLSLPSSPKMELPWIKIFAGTLTGTALTRLAPTSSGYKTSISPIPLFFLFFFTLLILAVTWKVILYPKLFSSLRHLPGPPVSRKLRPTPKRIFLISSQGWLLSEWPIRCH